MARLISRSRSTLPGFAPRRVNFFASCLAQAGDFIARTAARPLSCALMTSAALGRATGPVLAVYVPRSFICAET